MRYLIILIYLFFSVSFSHEYKKNGIEVIHPVLKMVSSNGKMGAGYLKIKNNTKKKVSLVSIDSKIAKKQEIHEVLLENNTYKMRPIKKGLIILPGKELVLKSKSYHIMFFDIYEAHETDEMLDAKLNFSDNLIINVKFKVLVGNSNHSH